MDKLVSHAIRMLEIVEGENDFFRNDAKCQADIARAVYDTILRVQVLERIADHKTEPQTDELREAKILLKASRDLLNKQNETIYVLNLLEETVEYHDVECDGYCLIDDIDDWLALQTEPQTCSVNGRPYSECSSCEHSKCTADEPQTETQNSNKNSNVISVYDGVSEAVRCAMCSNPNKSNRGCDGACSYDEKLYKRIMDAIDKSRVDTPQTERPCDNCQEFDCYGCEYKQTERKE